jgi:hypothetical protein
MTQAVMPLASRLHEFWVEEERCGSSIRSEMMISQLKYYRRQRIPVDSPTLLP